jgi:hypothetical protein
MIDLARRLGFEIIRPLEFDSTIRARLSLV